MTIPAVFLPGIIMPAADRYASLFKALGAQRPLVARDLAIYAQPNVPSDYSIPREVSALEEWRKSENAGRIHLYGHSAGGAVALAYVARYPQHVATLALDEPATDFSVESVTGPDWQALQAIRALPPAEQLGAFLRAQLREGVPPPAPPPEPPPPWMASRAAGVSAFIAALPRLHIPPERYRAFEGPVYYSYGGWSNPRWVAIRDRLAAAFPDFRADLYDGVHHLKTSHQAEPSRVARALRELWARRDGA